MSGPINSCGRILPALAAVAAIALAPVLMSMASAQTLTLTPAPPGATTAPQPLPGAKPIEGTFQAAARYSSDGTIINGGLHWRIYADRPDQSGVFRLLKEDTSPQPIFVLPMGDYIVHVALGLASAAKPVHVTRDPTRELFDIAGGGLRLEGRVGNVKIPPGQISFDIYKGSQFEQADNKRAVASSVQTGALVLVPEGTYYVQSRYG